ncbi:YodC family protein [Serratia sp. TSA_198.1]|uniref:YodC family protein n=1 Tax=Serratia sp. TSA_198.1 TaxID=3415664 RepID=UPI0040465F61
MAFTVGDFVQRTTGGPKMIVVAIDGDTLVCSWNELGTEQRAEVQANDVALYHEDGDFGVC